MHPPITTRHLANLHGFTAIIKVFFFKFGFKVGVEVSIVNEPLVLKTLIFQTGE
jgi:hypothetical protein